jgi:hypothetical protein
MADSTHATVRILRDGDEDAGELARLTRQLRAALLDLDGLDVETVSDDTPDGAKGAAAVLGWLSVTVGGALLTSVANQLATWAMSLGRTVEITVDGDTLKLGRVTHAEQKELISEWLARHPTKSADGLTSQERGYL